MIIFMIGGIGIVLISLFMLIWLPMLWCKVAAFNDEMNAEIASHDRFLKYISENLVNAKPGDQDCVICMEPLAGKREVIDL